MSELDSKKIKETELEILDYFVAFCKKHNLKYYLTYGSLLGAVRHKGFIPWDDDIDIHMPPKDYLKFLELYKNEDNLPYFLQNVTTEKYYHTIFSKIRKNNTCMVEQEWQYLKIHKGISIDIFALFPYPDNKIASKIFMFKLKMCMFLVSKNNKTHDLFHKIIFFLLRLIPRSITNKLVSVTIKGMLNYKGKSSYYKADDDSNDLFKKEWFDNGIMLKFEDKKYICPIDYDKVLKAMYYGDYMTIPPEDKRVGHGGGKIILSFDKNYEDISDK